MKYPNFHQLDDEMYETEPETNFEAETIETEECLTYLTLLPATRYLITQNIYTNIP